MKELWRQIAFLWVSVLSVTQARYKHIRKKNTRSLDTPNHTNKLEYQYPVRTDAYLRRSTRPGRIIQGNLEKFDIDIRREFKRENSDTKHKRKLDQHTSHDSSVLPQPAKPLRIVATSAVIKNRRKKPTPLKAIHIWGPTPFKTVIQNLQRLNENIERQRGAVKRLFLPGQLQRMQLINAFRKPPILPRPISPFSRHFPNFNPTEQFPAPDGIHLQEGPPSLPHQPGLEALAPPTESVPAEPAHQYQDLRPVHLQGMGSVPDYPPVREVSQVQEIAPIHAIEPAPEEAPMNDIGPVREIAPTRELLTSRDMTPIHDYGPSPDTPPNFEPPNGMFPPPFPWMAGEIDEEVNRHVHKGKQGGRPTRQCNAMQL